MRVLRVRNVAEALPEGLALLAEAGQPRPSRAGETIVAPWPVVTVYERPAERVLFAPERDANPFFHLFTALWTIAGRNDVAFPARFARRIADYSDDWHRLTGAYGHRWRRHWTIGAPGGGVIPVEQIERAVTLLRNHPDTRRALLTMWDPIEDLREDESGKDLPCNTQIFLRTRFGRRDEPNRLDLTVTCRSNDVIWGAYGENSVCFSMLQEYLAARLNLAIGTMYQISNDYHAYEDVFRRTYRGALAPPGRPAVPDDPYAAGEVAPFPLVENPAAWDRDLALFLEVPASVDFDNPFFPRVAKPLWFSHVAFKAGNLDNALEIVAQCRAADWRRAAAEWLERRRKP